MGTRTPDTSFRNNLGRGSGPPFEGGFFCGVLSRLEPRRGGVNVGSLAPPAALTTACRTFRQARIPRQSNDGVAARFLRTVARSVALR
jgi:hypothetical protein